MFDGSSEQFHQFIASSTTASLPISLPFPLHAFDHPYAPPPLHHHPPPPPSESRDPWSNDELLSLLKVRSSMEIWFPDFTWEHVSRKLGELGFKRSAEQCKEKFEEESRNFNTTKSYRMMSELDDFCHGDDDDQDRETEKPKKAEEEEIPVPQQVVVKKAISNKKRKRREKFETFKGFCEAVVKKMMAKQEELHNKLIQDILKRDEEKIARDEAWKNQEMERFRTQIETRSKDQKYAAQRQAAIIDFLTHFTSHNNDKQEEEEEEEEEQQQDQEQEEEELNNKSNSNSNSSSSIIPPSLPPPPPSPSSAPASDVGKRWPRDEVVALINLRCKMSGEQENNNSKEGSSSTKGPLWERISQGMKEMGYKRSAKRCKEKWENINKYFRKTKDSSKKRSLNSRTCPYFHHLSSLYGDGTIVTPTAASASASAPVVDLGGERAAVDVDVDGVF